MKVKCLALLLFWSVNLVAMRQVDPNVERNFLEYSKLLILFLTVSLGFYKVICRKKMLLNLNN